MKDIEPCKVASRDQQIFDISHSETVLSNLQKEIDLKHSKETHEYNTGTTNLASSVKATPDNKDKSKDKSKEKSIFSLQYKS